MNECGAEWSDNAGKKPDDCMVVGYRFGAGEHDIFFAMSTQPPGKVFALLEMLKLYTSIYSKEGAKIFAHNSRMDMAEFRRRRAAIGYMADVKSKLVFNALPRGLAKMVIPKAVKEKASKEEAEELKNTLEEAGATVTVK